MDPRIVFGERTLDGATLRERARRAARGLHEAGVRPGDAVALLLRNEPAYLEALLALQALGAYAVTVNWHFKRDEACWVIGDSGAKVLLVHDDLLPPIRPGLAEDLLVIVVDTPPEIRSAYRIAEAGASVDGSNRWGRWLEAFEPWTEPAPPPVGSIIYSSGTTGRPKGIRRLPGSREQADAWRRTRAQATRVWRGYRTAIVGPLYHGGPNTAAIAALADASLIVIMPRFDAEGLLRLTERYRLTHLSLVPIMLIRMLKLPDEIRLRHDLRSLEIVTHGGSACPPDIKRRAIDWLGPIVVETYGATEVGLVTMVTSQEWLDRPGTVGRPFDGTSIRILDDDGRELGPGRVGEIWVDPGPNSLPFVYHNQADERARVERDGHIANGDVGYLDEAGYLFITDRKRDMIVSGGVNIYSKEIEDVLIACPGVLDCAVFAVPDDEYGEAVAVAIVAGQDPAPSDEAIRAWLQERIASYKVPKLIERHAELPRDSMGKVFKRALRAPHVRES